MEETEENIYSLTMHLKILKQIESQEFRKWLVLVIVVLLTHPNDNNSKSLKKMSPLSFKNLIFTLNSDFGE